MEKEGGRAEAQCLECQLRAQSSKPSAASPVQQAHCSKPTASPPLPSVLAAVRSASVRRTAAQPYAAASSNAMCSGTHGGRRKPTKPHDGSSVITAAAACPLPCQPTSPVIRAEAAVAATLRCCCCDQPHPADSTPPQHSRRESNRHQSLQPSAPAAAERPSATTSSG